MSLATRCTGCGTVFRVGQDQLEAANGDVKCGRCDAAFNALETLFDLEHEAPPPWSPPADSGGNPPLPRAQQASAPAHGDDPRISDSSSIDRLDAQLSGSMRLDAASTPATRISKRDRLDFPDAQFDPDLLPDEFGADLEGPTPIRNSAPAPLPATSPTPSFIARDERQRRWRRPAVRIGLSLVALGLGLLLAGQGTYHFRDLIAARWPATEASLRLGCQWLECALGPARRIADITVESSALTRAPVPDAFKLAVALRNRSAMVLGLPSVDLSLTDAAGKLVVRRVLGPRDFGLSTAVIAPGAESMLQVVLATGSPRVTGYTVEIFYP
jgi:predicted Zn finger-like uncharacterized protein